MKVAYIQESTAEFLNSQGLALLQNADILSTLDVNQMTNFIETEFQKGVKHFVLNVGSERMETIVDYVQARPKFDCVLFVCTYTTANNIRLTAPPNFVFSITANQIFLERGMELISAGAGPFMITVVSGSGPFIEDVKIEGANYGRVFDLGVPADVVDLTTALNIIYPLADSVLTIAIAIQPSPEGDINSFVNILNNAVISPPRPIPIFSFDYVPNPAVISTSVQPFFVISSNVSDTLNYETAPSYLKVGGVFIPPNNATSIVLVNSPEYWCDYIRNKTLSRGLSNFGVTFNVLKQAS